MRAAFSIVLFFLHMGIFAQNDGHDHSGESEHKKVDPPHGGIILDAGKYQIELLFDPLAGEEKLTLWILNSKFKVRHPEKGIVKIKLNYKDGKIIEQSMINATERFYCNITDLTVPFNALIVLNIKNKTYNGAYYYKGLGK